MSASGEFRHNHYVPEWYQRRFLPSGKGKYFYLDLAPETVRSGGHEFKRRALRILGPTNCFAQDDLYTVEWGGQHNTDIERFFFGRVDRNGVSAIDYFDGFQHPGADPAAFHDLMTYMSVQKLRTPKGLGWLRQLSPASSRQFDLFMLQQLQNLFCAIWTECVWQIADADASATKFIVSDHPVTVYNRDCFPASRFCTGFHDPDIRMLASHTYFPLSMNKVLILTNLAWVRNPYQSERKIRPNPTMLRDAMFNYQEIQTHRSLSEQEVLQINYITKRRALRYIAAADRDWLYPEKRLSSTHWSKFGDGYLMMPEPRGISLGGEIWIGYKDGSSAGFGEYGHRPGQPGFKDEDRYKTEAKALERFRAEFARMQGPAWRGCSAPYARNGPHVDTDEFHQHTVRPTSRGPAARRAEKSSTWNKH